MWVQQRELETIINKLGSVVPIVGECYETEDGYIVLLLGILFESILRFSSSATAKNTVVWIDNLNGGGVPGLEVSHD